MSRPKPPVKGDEARLNQDRGGRTLDEGAQLGLFADDQGAIVPVEERSGPGRPAGSPNKAKAKLREYFTGRGYRDPAEQLALIAGLDRPDMHPLGHAAMLAELTGLNMHEVLKLQRQAASDLMPYWHAKLTPDVTVNAPTMNINMVPNGSAPSAVGRAMQPPPMPGKESEQNQGVSDGDDDGNSDEGRTE
jgi:hypothetical protein